MEQIFHWYLVCGICNSVFHPEENDWDGPIKCPGCEAKGLICHGDHEIVEEMVVEVELDPAEHSDWPQNLSDEELDGAFRTLNAMDGSRVEKLLQEYERRGRPFPATA